MNAQRTPASPRQGCEAAALQPGNVGYRRRVVAASWELQELGRGSGARQLEPIESQGPAAVSRARANRRQSLGGGSEEEGGRKRLVRWSRTLVQRAATGAGLRGSGGLVLRRVASKDAVVPSRGGARSLVARRGRQRQTLEQECCGGQSRRVDEEVLCIGFGVWSPGGSSVGLVLPMMLVLLHPPAWGGFDTTHTLSPPAGVVSWAAARSAGTSCGLRHSTAPQRTAA